MKDFSLLIASAFYEVKAYSPYITSLISSIDVMNQAGVKNGYISVNGDSYVDRAKNGLVHTFMKSPFTNLMIIDSDLEWDVEGFGRLLKVAMAGADMVGAGYRTKSDFVEYPVSPVIEDSQYIGNNDCGFPVIQVRSMPGGFTIYSRKAFEMVSPILKTYDMDEDVTEYFACNILEENGRNARLGEDIYFQRQFIKQGGTMYVVPNVNITHWGTKGYPGNFEHEMMKRPGSPKFLNMIDRLRFKHKGDICWIVGKGSSLQYLKKHHIGPGPIIAINESIIPIENLGLDNPIYSLQKDADPPDKDPIAPPKKAALLIHERETPNRHKDYLPRYTFDNPMDFNCSWNTCSAVTATNIALMMGCTWIVYVSFDAAVTGNLDVCHYKPDGIFVIDRQDPDRDDREYKKLSLGLKGFIKKQYLHAQWLIPEPEGESNNETEVKAASN